MEWRKNNNGGKRNTRPSESNYKAKKFRHENQKQENSRSLPSKSSSYETMLLDPSLHKAAKHSNTEEFMALLHQISTSLQIPVGTIIEQVTPSGDSLLHLASSHGNDSVAAYLASEFRSLISKKNIKNDTPVHLAARASRLTIIKTLVQCASQPPSSNNRWLLKMKNVNGNTPLHVAVMSHDCEIVEFLVNSGDSEVIYFQNKEGWSPLYMAVKAGNVEILKPLLRALVINDTTLKRLEDNSPVHAAIMEKNLDILREMVNEKKELLKVKDGKGGTPLHFAAVIGYLPGVEFLLEVSGASALERNGQGSLPIHLACQSGHVHVIKELLKVWPDPKELLTKEGQNILHIAAKCGKSKVVKFILNTTSLGQLVNEKDRNGNTPLHLAAMNWHPMAVTYLTWDKRVNIKLVNNNCLTALDVAFLQLTKGQWTFRERKTIQILKSAGSHRSFDLKLVTPDRKIIRQFEPLQMEWIKDRINTLLLVETLVATVTFTAGFTLPGGYNGCDCPDQGIATMLKKGLFHVFVICNTLSLYTSMITLVTLMWAQLGDAYLAITAYTFSKHLFGIAIGFMSLAFTAAVCLAINKLTWLFIVVLVLSSIFLIVFMMHFIALIFPHGSTARFMRYISYYINLVLIPASGSSMRIPTQHQRFRDFQYIDKDRYQGFRHMNKDNYSQPVYGDNYFQPTNGDNYFQSMNGDNYSQQMNELQEMSEGASSRQMNEGGKWED